ncbi:hypothetical protein [uncultured Ruegeria sp.]|uniref:hypothetical protein n=1 Tax=uncultured Ruegeria sp. TaxID=259304 RepID=UPI00260352B4|nr:hypothetical protein [uncultured Ruegeria sp.]
MRAGTNGQIAISWCQTEIDGLEDAPLSSLMIGASWSWRGQAIVLSETVEQSIGKMGNAGGVATHVNSHFPIVREVSGPVSGILTFTNGAQKFSAKLVVDGKDTSRTLVFDGACPPRDEEFWIVEVTELAVIPNPPLKSDATVVSFPISN